MHLLDALHLDGAIKVINVYHEQSAAFAADAIGRMTGIPGVALATSGPGAINLLTGIGSSYFDSSPTVFITGQVNRHEQKGAKPIRQLGFQETDIVVMASAITKMAVCINDPSTVPAILEQAFTIAVDGRPGSVLVDIPMDVFRAKLDPLQELKLTTPTSTLPRPPAVDSLEIASLLRAIAAAKCPIILAGNGVRASGGRNDMLRFAELLNLPVVHSLLACDLLPYSHPLRCGMIGTYGNRWANVALSQADLILVLGSRLDIRQTGAETASFARGRVIYHVEVDFAEINNRLDSCIGIHSDLLSFFECAIAIAQRNAPGHSRYLWHEQIANLRRQWPDTSELQVGEHINPNHFMHQLTRGRNFGAVCVDVGLHQMWAAQSMELAHDSRFLTSGGMGAMGFALPAAVGAAFSLHGASTVLVVAGDGGFQINIQELQCVAHHRLPLKMVVMNNRCNGMTRAFQDTYFESRRIGTAWGYSAPNFVSIAAAYGIASRLLSSPESMDECIAWLWADPLEPCLLEVSIDLATNAYPKMAFGRPMSEMEPFAAPLEMKGT